MRLFLTYRLSPAFATTVEANIHLDEVKTSNLGDFKTTELSEKMSTPQMNQLIVQTYSHLASSRRSTLIFCVDLAHVDLLVEAFRKAGIDARSVSSQNKGPYRRMTLEAFMRGDFPVLINCEVLTEGADIPVVRPHRRKWTDHRSTVSF